MSRETWVFNSNCFILLHLFICLHMLWHTCRSQRTTYGSHVFPFALWVPGIEFRLSVCPPPIAAGCENLGHICQTSVTSAFPSVRATVSNSIVEGFEQDVQCERLGTVCGNTQKTPGYGNDGDAYVFSLLLWIQEGTKSSVLLMLLPASRLISHWSCNCTAGASVLPALGGYFRQCR